MAAGLEQAAALDRKQRGAADRQLDAELFCGEPGLGLGMAAGAAGVREAVETTEGLEVFLREGEVMGGGSGERQRSRHGSGLQAWDVPIRESAQPTAKFNPAETSQQNY
jgi:hypothetical protein